VTLSGSGNFTGGTNLVSGNLTAAGNYALGNPASTNPNAGLQLNPAASTTVNVFFTSANPNIAALNNPGAGTSNVILGGTTGAGSATTLNIGPGDSGTSTFTGVISDLSAILGTAIGNLNVYGGATLILDGTNTYTGTTTITGGTTQIIIASPNTIEDSIYNTSGGGILNTGTFTTLTLGGLSGTGSFALVSSGTPLALTIGNDNVSSTYNGSLTGPGTVTKTGTGTTTFSNASYTGVTTIDAGNLTISGGLAGSSTSTVTIAETGNGLTVSGGTLTAGALNIALLGGQTGGSASITGSGSGVFTTVTIGGTGDSAGGLTIDTTGSVALGAFTIIKLNAGAAPNTGLGLVIEAGTVTALSVDAQGFADKSADVNISGGSLTIGNSSSNAAFEVGNAGDGGYLDMTGGSLVYAGTDGLLLATGVGSTGLATITSGTATLTGITLNVADSTTELSTLTVGGTTPGAIPVLYLGSVGLVEYAPAGSGTSVGVTFGNATIGAIAAWNSSAPITLTGTTTFQTADSLGNPNNITLSGTLSGTGGLTAAGPGSLTLSGDDTYTGSTTVTGSGGRLIVSGSLGGTTPVSVAANAHLEVDGLLNNSASVAVSGFLNGTGELNGATIASGGTLGPGRNSLIATSAGTLTANGAVTLTDSTSVFSVRLGVASPGDSDQLAVTPTNSITLNDATLKLTLGSAFAPQTPGFIYVLINGGASATGSGSDVFSQGSSITDADGDTYDILYAVTSAGTPGGSDVDLELVGAIPEPGAWPSILGGMGILAIWHRVRRRRYL
jgi:autotransporter-associated beta strand protein